MNPKHKIKKGSLVRIGQNKKNNVSPKAVGLELILDEDVSWGGTQRGTIVKNPNGWHLNFVLHTFCIKSDVVLQGPCNHTLSRNQLEKADD